MVPEGAIGDGDGRLPAGATYWMPSPAEVTEEGFGFFRDTWRIRGVSIREARSVMAEERSFIEVIGEVAADEAHYERLAVAAESARSDDLDDGSWDLSSADLVALRGLVSDLPPDLGGLELGVAGLVMALAAVRILPAASCRSHYPASTSWSPVPAVLFASIRPRAEALAELVGQTRCVFGLDPGRPDLLVVSGPSPLDLMDLAELVLSERSSFVQRRGARVQRDPAGLRTESVQDQLF